MSRPFLKIRHLIEYGFILILYGLLKIQPRFILKIVAYCWGTVIYRLPGVYKLVNANIKTAFPEKDIHEIRRIGRMSLVNNIRNMLEFFWMTNNKRRIEKCTLIPPDVLEMLKSYAHKDGKRVVMVNPHLGSWEASGLIAPYYSGMKLTAIASPLANPYLNRLLNTGSRERTGGMNIIFSKGAVRASNKALRDGFNIGILIDQNTKVRAGGVFVNFFGLPVASSKAPAEFVRFGKTHGIEIEVIFGVSIREKNGVVTAQSRPLSKPSDEYDDTEMIQEIISISEEFIRRYPEHYLWLYKRFAHIPQGLDENLRKRYPYYARVVKDSFYSKVKKA